MPSPPLSNTFEGGTDGVAITTGNSGGASGDAFTSIAGTLCKFEQASPLANHGATYMQVVDAVGSNRCQWEALGTITTDVWIRDYLRISVTPVTEAATFFKALTQAGTAHVALRINTATRFMQAENAAGSAIAASIGDVAVPTNDWIRVEARILASATAGQIEWKWWDDPDDTGTPTDTASATGQVLGANTGAALFGISASAPATPFTIDHDDIAVSATDWLGPSFIPAEEIEGRRYLRFVGPVQLGTSAADLYTVPAGTRITIRNLYVNNPSGSEVEFTLSVGNDAAGTRLLDQHAVPANDSYASRRATHHALEAGEKIQGFADAATTVVVIDGYIEAL